MQIPENTKPALWGAVGGAIVLAVVGFSWGGWVTSSTAADMSSKESVSAVTMALTPYCLENAKTSANSAKVMAELDAASTFQRRGIVEEAGWATMLGSDAPNREVAQACQKALADNG